MQSPTRQHRDAFEQLCLLRALYAHRGPLDRACEQPDAGPSLGADELAEAADQGSTALLRIELARAEF